jgi:hypothetical protein
MYPVICLMCRRQRRQATGALTARQWLRMLRRVGAAAQPELNAVGDEAGLEDAAPGADRVVRARVQDVTISGNFRNSN